MATIFRKPNGEQTNATRATRYTRKKKEEKKCIPRARLYAVRTPLGDRCTRAPPTNVLQHSLLQLLLRVLPLPRRHRGRPPLQLAPGLLRGSCRDPSAARPPTVPAGDSAAPTGTPASGMRSMASVSAKLVASADSCHTASRSLLSMSFELRPEGKSLSFCGPL